NIYFFFSSRRRHTRFSRDWSSDVCSSDLTLEAETAEQGLDWQEVLEQQALEQRERQRLGLPMPGEVTVREQAAQEDGGGSFEYRDRKSVVEGNNVDQSGCVMLKRKKFE